jgi:hypothetical protein
MGFCSGRVERRGNAAVLDTRYRWPHHAATMSICGNCRPMSHNLWTQSVVAKKSLLPPPRNAIPPKLDRPRSSVYAEDWATTKSVKIAFALWTHYKTWDQLEHREVISVLREAICPHYDLRKRNPFGALFTGQFR